LILKAFPLQNLNITLKFCNGNAFDIKSIPITEFERNVQFFSETPTATVFINSTC